MSPLALITGATSGIGAAYAAALAADGYDLIAVGRNEQRLQQLVDAHPDVHVRPLAADLGSDAGIATVAQAAGAEPLDLLVNNAGVAHYMPITQLPADLASELIHVKELAPTLLTRAAVPGMLERGSGTIVNMAGMLAFGADAPQTGGGRATYVASLAHLVAFTRTLAVELADSGLRLQVCCPGVVATEFHTRQGMDLSAIPRMSAEDVVRASRAGLELGEVLCAPGVEDAGLLDAVAVADLAAFSGQSPELASRYRS